MWDRFLVAALFFAGTVDLRAHNCSEAGSISTKTCTADGSLSDTQAAVTYVIGRGEAGWVITTGTEGASYTWSADKLSMNSSEGLTLQAPYTPVPTTLSAAIINPGATSISVNSTSGFYPASGDYVIQIDDEDMKVTAGHGTTTWTVVRGWNMTSAVSHTNGSTVKLLQAGAGLTTITLSYSGGAYPIEMSGSANKPVILKNFKFKDWTQTAALYIGGTGVNTFRVTNSEFFLTSGAKHAIRINGPQARDILVNTTIPTEMGPYGVFDHLTCNNRSTLVFVRDYDCERSWREPMSWSTNKKVVLEDSMLNGGGAFDGDTGCRISVRHCSGVNWGTTNHEAEGDPATSTGHGLHAALQKEVNNCTFTTNTSADPALNNGEIFIRAGAARIWSVAVFRPSGDNLPGSNFIKATYYRDTVEGAGATQVVQDRTTTNPPTSRTGTDYLGTGQPGMGVVDWGAYSGPSDPNYTDHVKYPWGLVPIRAWNITKPAGLSFPMAVYGTFVRDPEDAYLSVDDSAQPADFAEYQYPHEMVVGVLGESDQPATSFRKPGSALRRR